MTLHVTTLPRTPGTRRTRLNTTLGRTRLRVRKLVRAARRPRLRAALRQGVLAATDHQDSGLGGPFATVVDVGASRGQFASWIRDRHPDARIVCFEPLAEAAGRIRAVVDGPVEVHVAAVGARPGRCTLHVSAAADSSSLLPIGRQAREFQGTAEAAVREVPVTTLDEHLDADIARPALLKIDVQGYELEVLRGATRVLDSVQEILCECSFVELYVGQPLAGDVVAHLAGRGFRLVHVAGISTGVDGEQLQADLTFRRVAG